MDHAIVPRGQAARGGGSVPLFRIGGIRIGLDYSWFLIFLLILVSLSVGYFPAVAPQASVASHWAAGLLASLLFFASILAHELSHSWVAVRAGIPVPEITLFLFGGVSRISEEPKDPKVELRVAIAGPLMSFVLAGLFGLAYLASPPTPWMISSIVGYMAWINLALGIFNLLPGFPLDGGRVLRALIWWRTGSLRRGTKVASNAGRTFAVALMLLGGIEILGGALFGGMWMILIGMFLHGMAKRGYEEVLLRGVLDGVDVDRVMVPESELVDVPADLSLRELVDVYFLGHGHRGYPVVEGGRPVGLVSIAEVRAVPRDDWDTTKVRDVMTPLDERTRIAPDASVLEALKRLRPGGPSRLVVTQGDHVLGLVSSGSVSRYVELKSLLQEA